MKRKYKIIILLNILILTIVAIICIIINTKKWENINIFDTNDLSKVEEKVENATDKEIICKINDEEIYKYDIEAQKEKIEWMTEEEKELLNESSNPVVSTIKRFVEEQEAIKANIQITDEKKEKFKQVADKMYESEDGSENKDNFVKKWIEIQERDELADLFMAKTIKEITLNKLECEDKTVNDAINNFKNDATIENLSKAYNEYIMYLSKQYNVMY